MELGTAVSLIQELLPPWDELGAGGVCSHGFSSSGMSWGCSQGFSSSGMLWMLMKCSGCPKPSVGLPQERLGFSLLGCSLPGGAVGFSGPGAWIDPLCA